MLYTTVYIKYYGTGENDIEYVLEDSLRITRTLCQESKEKLLSLLVRRAALAIGLLPHTIHSAPHSIITGKAWSNLAPLK